MASRGSVQLSAVEVAWLSQVCEKLLRGADVSAYRRHPKAKALAHKIKVMEAQAKAMKRRTEKS